MLLRFNKVVYFHNSYMCRVTTNAADKVQKEFGFFSSWDWDNEGGDVKIDPPPPQSDRQDAEEHVSNSDSLQRSWVIVEFVEAGLDLALVGGAGQHRDDMVQSLRHVKPEKNNSRI